MNLNDARRIAEDLRLAIAPACTEAICVGSVRRCRHEVHDIEILCKPLPGNPRPEFGSLRTFESHLDKVFFDLEQEHRIVRILGGLKMKKFAVHLPYYGLGESLNGFQAEFYIVTPPAEWGVGMVIRTGPGSEQDNFSRWCVTNKSMGGCLPDGWKVRHLGVWNVDQLDSRHEPMKGESPLPMPQEQDFLNFLGLPWIEPPARHAPTRR